MLQDFLTSRRQPVKVSCPTSDWSDIRIGIFQGSVLGHIMFLIYINDLPDTLLSCIKLVR